MVIDKELSAIIDIIGQIWNGIKKVKKFTKAEREKYRETIGETLRLLDNAINLIINRLGDLLIEENRSEFWKKLKGLNNVTEWYCIENDVRLCQNLRYASRDMDTLLGKLSKYIAISDPDSLMDLMGNIFEKEVRLADYIGRSLNNLASMYNEDYDKALKAVQKFKEGLLDTRKKLVSLEAEIIKSI